MARRKRQQNGRRGPADGKVPLPPLDGRRPTVSRLFFGAVLRFYRRWACHLLGHRGRSSATLEASGPTTADKLPFFFFFFFIFSFSFPSARSEMEQKWRGWLYEMNPTARSSMGSPPHKDVASGQWAFALLALLFHFRICFPRAVSLLPAILPWAEFYPYGRWVWNDF